MFTHILHKKCQFCFVIGECLKLLSASPPPRKSSFYSEITLFMIRIPISQNSFLFNVLFNIFTGFTLFSQLQNGTRDPKRNILLSTSSSLFNPNIICRENPSPLNIYPLLNIFIVLPLNIFSPLYLCQKMVRCRGGQKLNGRLNAVQKSQTRSRPFNIPFNPFNGKLSVERIKRYVERPWTGLTFLNGI